MATLGLERDIVDEGVLERTVGRFREAGIVLPTFSQLADPSTIPDETKAALADVEPDDAHPLNLFRVHWNNDDTRKAQAALPAHVVLPKELTGVDAKIIVAFGDRFPMIRAHKVLAAYGCLAPRIVTGQFDPTTHKAIWPSTGNYCRGGVAISRIMGCRGVAVLPEGMSEERFNWLENWVANPADIIRTVGTESNVKEIYDKCQELDRDEQNIIFNQFCEFSNHLAHFFCTGKALSSVFEANKAKDPNLQLAAYVSATGSAGTLAAGDYLKDHHGARVVAVEAVECPTILYNGFGEHNIQGIGDKHIPYIHNTMNTDVAVAISDASTDSLGLLFNTEVGQKYLTERRGLSPELVQFMTHFGFSGVCNTLAAIKTAKYYGFGPEQAILTVATDGWELYTSEENKILSKYFGGDFDSVKAAETWGQHMLGVGQDHLRELTHQERERVFNLGYYTWVEQQGVDIEDFQARRDQSFWRGLRELTPIWDELINEFNKRVAAG